MNDLQLNPKLFSDDFNKFQISIQQNLPFKVNDDIYITEPYSVGYINDLILMPESFFKRIISQLKLLKLSSKSNDLYKFHQSKDFKFFKKSKILQEIRSFFLKNILPWLKKATLIDLFDDEIDITFSVYKDSDYLLCHDDHLESRRIAFVWYLVDEEWSEKEGGHLDIISTNEQEQPTEISKSFLPKHNSFVFFKVADNSYHQVREVQLDKKSLEKCRISVNGWFRGPSLKFKEPPVIPAPERLSPVHVEESLFYEWINNIYLSDETIKSIRKNFVNDSEVQLADFFDTEKHTNLTECLRAMKYCIRGPMNVMQMYVSVTEEDNDEYPDIVRQVRRVLGSEAMMVLLSDVTNLSLHSTSQRIDSDNSDPESDVESIKSSSSPSRKRMKLESGVEDVCSVGTLSKVELRHWKSGCYSLLRDGDMRHKENRLEMFFSVVDPPCEERGLDCGGFYSYFAEGEDEELLTIMPQDNSLSLVYADDQTMGFMKYFTHRFNKLTNESQELSREPGLYDFHATFYEYE